MLKPITFITASLNSITSRITHEVRECRQAITFCLSVTPVNISSSLDADDFHLIKP